MEPKDDDNKIVGYVPGEVVFTRYLYPKLYVKQSLLMALLDHNYDETLYWTYELYFSGFEDETYDYVFQMYNELYKETHPSLSKHFDHIRACWYKNTLQYWLIGSVVATLCYCNYRMDHFVQTYFKVNCTYTLHPPKKIFLFRLCERDIYEYKINKYMNPPRKYLGTVCKYGVRSNIIHLFAGDIEDLNKKWYHNWLYYASLSPIWRERLDDFNVKINSKAATVEFEEEEDEEHFFERWNLEPDEQPALLQHTIIGDPNAHQYGLKEFCEKYGCRLILKTIRAKK